MAGRLPSRVSGPDFHRRVQLANLCWYKRVTLVCLATTAIDCSIKSRRLHEWAHDVLGRAIAH
jgi:hypothetical protein